MFLNQTAKHILSHYILLRVPPNLTQTDWAISIIWFRYIMPKKKKNPPRFHSVNQQHLSQHFI